MNDTMYTPTTNEVALIYALHVPEDRPERDRQFDRWLKSLLTSAHTDGQMTVVEAFERRLFLADELPEGAERIITESQVRDVRALVPLTTDDTELDGATTPGAKNAYPGTTGEFAARWNSWQPRHRESWLAEKVRWSATAARCYADDHDGQIASLLAEVDRLNAFVSLMAEREWHWTASCDSEFRTHGQLCECFAPMSDDEKRVAKERFITNFLVAEGKTE